MSIESLSRRLAALNTARERPKVVLTTEEARAELVALVAEAKGIPLDGLNDSERRGLLALGLALGQRIEAARAAEEPR